MAIRITRVYTRTGDRGDTALVGGRRVPKDSGRIEASLDANARTLTVVASALLARQVTGAGEDPPLRAGLPSAGGFGRWSAHRAWCA